MSTTSPDPRRWLTLGIVGAAFFMTILDVSIVNVALPSIGKSLGVGDKSLQWVITAYAITYGGFLLLGGRSADLLGRRKVFLAGLGLFTVSSLACGLAGSLGVLIGARAFQGLGAAIIAPAALSIVMTAFAEGPERNKALGIWGALGGSGAAVGVLAGGVITKWLGWSWIFFVNVPVGIAVLVLCLLYVRESRIEVEERRFDPLGALLASGSLVILVYAISKAPDNGWGSAQTIGLLIAAALGTVAFFAVERRVKAPLMPLSILKVRTVFGANIVGFLLGAVIFANFFILTFYVQQVLGFSALKTGYTFLATAGTVVLWAGVSQALVTRVGARPVMTAGLIAMGIALILYTSAPSTGHFVRDLLPGYLIFAFGIAFAFVPVSIAALAGVQSDEAGLASGLINTNQQIGGAIGVALASTIATSRFTSLVHEGVSTKVALTEGFHRAFWMLAIVAFVGAAAALLLVRDSEIVPVGEAEAARAPVA